MKTGIDVLPDGTALPVKPRQSLLELCLGHRIPLTHACGGMARCSTCRVVVLHGAEHCTARNAAEQDLANRLGLDTHVRLACQTHRRSHLHTRVRFPSPALYRRICANLFHANGTEGSPHQYASSPG